MLFLFLLPTVGTEAEVRGKIPIDKHFIYGCLRKAGQVHSPGPHYMAVSFLTPEIHGNNWNDQ